MTTVRKFQRTKEDFTCDHCGFFVHGTGYTNHCPQCLWSKHVDIHPGDRMATCSGLMEPVALETTGDTQTLTHHCVRCGHEKRNRVSSDDDFEMLVTLSRQFAERVAL